MGIVSIVSGGQTGADTGALDAAIWCKIPHGGWCPKGRRREHGIIPAKYHLREMTSKDYARRTEANVVDSDATLLFTFGPPTGGSRLTARLAEKHSRPLCHVDLDKLGLDYVPELSRLFFGTGDLPSKVPSNCILNVAGSRESGSPGICRQVTLWMIEIIGHVNGTVFYPPSSLRPVMRNIIREKKRGH